MSEKEEKSGSRLNRRGFLKSVAATGAMGAIAAAHPAFAEKSPNQNNTTVKSWRDKPDPIDESLISNGMAMTDGYLLGERLAALQTTTFNPINSSTGGKYVCKRKKIRNTN
jgi:hypothetical protein